jgi:mycothiol synthase
MNIPAQLQMVRPRLDDLPAIEVPRHCALRSYEPGDEAHWARIMNDCVGKSWTAQRCLEELVQRSEFRSDGCFFATVEGVPQGSATAWVKAELAPEQGYVHMVGVAPAYRGLRLGVLTTLATLHWFREHGFSQAVLNTDDWRIPAIGVYLKLGFEPVLFNESHTQRWRDVCATLGRPAPG